MNKLIVKNFGPLKNVEIDLNKINLFIGENGSGKSVLAKLLNILKNFSHENSITQDFFEDGLKSFGISYLTKDSVIEYKVNNIILMYKNSKINLKRSEGLTKTNIKELSIISDLIAVKKKIYRAKNTKKEILDPIKDQLDDLLSNEIFKELFEDIDSNKLDNLETIIQEKLSNEKSHYIPAERNLISIFSESMFSFLSSGLSIPKYLIYFGNQFELARNKIKNLNLLDCKYVYENNKDTIYFSETESLSLDTSSSGMQSILPMLLVIKYLNINLEINNNTDIIIEEPEQNLFPQGQFETIKYILELNSKNNNLFMMTHSPYVLSTLNILLYAYKTGNLTEKSRVQVEKIIPSSQWINPDEFSVYYLENGVARDIKGRTGLISDNEIDDISDEITSEFNELVSIYREYKNDK